AVGGGGWASVLAPLVIVALAVPVFVVVSLLVAALLMTPAIVRLVAARRFATLERRHGGGFWSGIAVSLGCNAVALAALVVRIPFWFVPPLVLVLPALICVCVLCAVAYCGGTSVAWCRLIFPREPPTLHRAAAAAARVALAAVRHG